MPKCPECNKEYSGEACPDCQVQENRKTPESLGELMDSLHPNRYIRAALKVLLAALLLAVIALVVFGTDAAIGWFKSLF